jgi:hypothetical protein
MSHSWAINGPVRIAKCWLSTVGHERTRMPQCPRAATDSWARGGRGRRCSGGRANNHDPAECLQDLIGPGPMPWEPVLSTWSSACRDWASALSWRARSSFGCGSAIALRAWVRSLTFWLVNISSLSLRRSIHHRLVPQMPTTKIESHTKAPGLWAGVRGHGPGSASPATAGAGSPPFRSPNDSMNVQSTPR